MHSAKYVGSSFRVGFGPGLWATQPAVVHCGSPFPLVLHKWKAHFVTVTGLWHPERAVCAGSGMLQGIFCATDAASATALAVCAVGGRMLKGKFEQ